MVESNHTSSPSSSRRQSAVPGPVISPPRQPIPRSSSVSASINFFESKTHTSPSPPVSVPIPREGSASGSGSGSPKPVGPRTMSPPTKQGRRLSYKLSSEEKGKSMDDQRRGLGVGSVSSGPQGGRRVSEGGIGIGIGVAGPSRMKPRLAGTNENGGGPSTRSTPHSRSRTSSTTTPPGSREPSATRRPVLRPRQPSDRPQPTIRVVHPTPRSQQSYRRTSAPPESPITPTRTRAFSPVQSTSKAASSASSTSVSSRSIHPGTRRTSYQLAKTPSNDGSSVSSAISEFGVIGEQGESPYLSNFAERFEHGSNETRHAERSAKSFEIPRDTGSPLVDTSPCMAPESPYLEQQSPEPSKEKGKGRVSETSSIKTNSSSSFVSARSPTSPPNIPRRISSNPTSPRIGRRTSSIDGISASSTPVLPLKSHAPSLGPILRTFSRDSQESSESGAATRRNSETTVGPSSRRPSTAAGAGTSIGTGILHTRRPSSPIPESPPIPPTKSITPHTSPRPDRKSPGLTINPLAPPRPPRDITRPSPPVPVKSPLRRLTPQRSTLSELSEGRSQKVREGSGESTAATSDSFLTAPLPSPSPSQSGSELALEPGDVVPFPASYDGHEAEIRFTMLTVPSVYSQDSAPSTAKTTTTDNESLRSARSGSYGWGRQRHSVISLDNFGPGSLEDSNNRTASLPRLRTSVTDTGKNLPETPSTAADSAASSSTRSRNVDNGHSPLTPARSPSMPTMNPIIEAPRKAAALLGVGTATITRPPAGMTRSQTTPMGGLFPIPSASPTELPSPNTSSKRSHLLREIVNTERSYANDLALVRDAYLLRYIRPPSQVSTNESTLVPSEQSRRNSVYTYQSADTKRSSGHEISSNWVAVSPYQKSPIPDPTHGPNYFSPMLASSSTTSLAPTLPRVSTSSRNTSGASSIGSMAPPVGKPMSPADIRTVFLNLDQLAMAATEMANAMDKALGEENGQARVGRDGESGSDRLGETFVTMMPRFRPLYEFYCARQSTAFVRLTEILAEPAHRTFLDECWSHVKPHTHAWNLDSMLIKPIQRITKYPLLFDDLLACTTPVHPDYFHIRNAAALAKSVAQEIDETKRRKDVVAGVISKKQKSQSNLTPSNVPKPKGLKMFRKDKSAISLPMSNSTSALESGSASGLVAEITKTSLSHFKDLVHRVDQYDQCVRKVGKEIILWTAAAKDICMIQDGVVKAWLGLISLDGLEGPDPKMVWFRKVIAGFVNDSWRVLNDQVQDQIMPSLAKLLESGVNPRKVILKRDSRAPDYARYFTLVETKKPVDRIVVQSAHDFVALHTQLVEELPPFLEGYMRIFDLCICAFANAQARYHATVQEKVEAYIEEYIDGIKRSPEIPQGQDEVQDLRTGRGVERNWKAGWQPFSDMIDNFQIIKPARQVASRLATFQDRPGSHTHTRQLSSHSQTHTRQVSGQSRSNSPLPPSRSNTPALSPTFMKDQKRNRSTSLMGPPPVPSPTREKSGFFGLKKTTPTIQDTKPAVVSPMKAIPRLRSPSPIDPGIRNSFGLPTISPDNGKFSGLGWSPSKPTQNLRHASENYPRRSHSRNGSTSSLSSNVGLGIGMGGGDTTFTSLLRRKSSDGRSRKSSGTGGLSANGSTHSQSQSRSKEDRRRKALSMVSASELQLDPPPGQRPIYARTKSDVPKNVDASAGWRGERVLYQCACVAAFDPDEVGRRKYRGLEFLGMVVGDLFDVFHEVGRIDELPNFPYPELGVENDGVLVAQSEFGAIGLIICSFLEPLT